MFLLRRWALIGLCIVQGGMLAAQQPGKPLLPREKLAREFFGNDATWYLENIPFLEIDDSDIERTYYYRWKLYRSHLREIGAQGTEETEFLTDVPWAGHPYEDLNDSSSFHILEGRWLRNPAFVELLVDHLYAGGGNDRHFSESIAAATFAWTQVTGNPAPALRHLDAMQHVFNLWNDHFDARRGLYWIEPLLDATEYTISSIDASGAGFSDKPEPGHDGFFGGFAFRPSINAYQFGNAQAIAALAGLARKPSLAEDYTRRAQALRQATLSQLWNPDLQHFTDVYQRSTKTVIEGQFVRGRELVGMVPWQFELPPAHASSVEPDFGAAWQHVLSTSQLGGADGLRTAEPGYPRYLVQYRYDKATGLPECQWNGPSWPFQTSQALSGVANFLHDYPHPGVSSDDYVHLLRQYTRQHQLSSGVLDLQEDYDPDTGLPIVGLPRSHHYNHSTYVDLVLSGLIGIRPHTDDVLEIAPLLPAAGSSEPAIHSFALEGLRYHGHELAIVYDDTGKHYGQAAGLTVWCDGKRLLTGVPLGRVTVPLPKSPPPAAQRVPIDVAVNVWARAPSPFEADLPIANASSTADGAQLYEALDGRLWFFPEIAHGWSPATHPPDGHEDWYSIDLRTSKLVRSVELAFFSDEHGFSVPAELQLQVRSSSGWTNLQHAIVPVENGMTRIGFPPVQAREFRILLHPPASGLRVRLIAFRVFGL